MGPSDFRARLSGLRFQAVALVAGAALFGLAPALWIYDGSLERLTLSRGGGALEAGRDSMKRWMDQRVDGLLAEVREASQESALKQGLRRQDRELLRTFLHDREERSISDRILILDEAGRVLADSEQRYPPYTDLPKDAPFWSVLNGEESHGTWSDGGRLYQWAAAPVLSEPEVLGVIMEARLLGGRTLDELRGVTGMDVSLFSSAGFISSTLGDATWPDLKVRRFGEVAETSRVTRVGGKSFLEFGTRLGQDAELVLHQSVEREAALWRKVRRGMMAWSIAVLSLAMAAGILFARSLAQPLESLIREMDFIRLGRHGRRLSVNRRDELGSVAEAFNKMIQHLRAPSGAWSAFHTTAKSTGEKAAASNASSAEVRTVSLLFSDIREITGLVDALDPTQLVTLINEHLTRLYHAVGNNHGTMDRSVGDAMLAVFGAPVPRPEDADNALQCAQDVITSLKEFNYRRAWEGKPELRINLGVNTGPVIAGAFGPEGQKHYSVMGDSVNLATRLEGLARLYNVNCLVSEFTQAACRKEFQFRELDRVRVKGRPSPLRVLELWDPWQSPTVASEAFQIFQTARRFYLLRDWARSENLFKQVQMLLPGDGPSQLYLARVQQLKLNPPKENWDGVYTIVTK